MILPTTWPNVSRIAAALNQANDWRLGGDATPACGFNALRGVFVLFQTADVGFIDFNGSGHLDRLL